MDTIYMSSGTLAGYPRASLVFKNFIELFNRISNRIDPIPIAILLIVILNFLKRLLYLCLKRRNPNSLLLFMNPDTLIITTEDEKFLIDNFQFFFENAVQTVPTDELDVQYLQKFTSFNGTTWKLNSSSPFINYPIHQIPFSDGFSHSLAPHFSFDSLEELLIQNREMRVELYGQNNMVSFFR